MLHLLWILCALLGYFADPTRAEIEYNTINDDGSFQFRYKDVCLIFHLIICEGLKMF